MSDNARSREHVHPVCMPAPHYIGIGKLYGNLEISKPAAVLLALNEGLYRLGAISEEDYRLLNARYRRKLKDVIAERQGKKEPSHVPVLTIEKTKTKQRRQIDYSTLTLDKLQEQYSQALLRNDFSETQFILLEAKKRNVRLKQEGEAI